MNTKLTSNNENIKMQYINANNRSNLGEDENKPKRGGACCCCGKRTTFYRCELPTGAKYICRECAEMLESYSFEDFREAYFTVHGVEMISVKNTDKISIGMELETMGDSLDARIYLITNGFIPTSDCTVTVEFKSSIYYNLSAITKICGMIEYMDKSPNFDFSVNNEQCGLHTHFGYNNMNLQPMLKVYYTELFKPLNSYVCSLTSEQRIAIFGSDFRYYADVINFFSPMEHRNWINIQHEKTIEVRLFRFTSATQYTKAVKVFRAMFNYLFNEFHTLDYAGTSYNFPLVQDEGRKIAKKIGKLMLDKFIKEYSDIL